MAERFAALAVPADAAPGRVVRVERAPADQGAIAAGIVRTPAGELLAISASEPVAVGDWVALHDGSAGTGDEPARIAAVTERWTALVRADPASAGTEQVLAANVDLVLIVAPLDRLRTARVERELLVAWESGAEPVVVVSKADLGRDAPGEAEALARRTVTRVIVTSTRTGEGLDEVREALRPDLTGVLLGPSGAGKSSLANALLGEEVLDTGEVREGDRRGRHTTTSRQLVPLPGGGALVDTPGLRAVALAGRGGGLAAAFADVEAVASACRFADCRHDREPGCAVLAGVEAGTLVPARLASYRKLRDELENVGRKRPRR